MLVLLSLAGCNPQDAEVQGTWFAWLAANSSATVDEELIDLSNASRIECSGRGWDSERNDWDAGYVGPKKGEDQCHFLGGACDPSDECTEDISVEDFCGADGNRTVDCCLPEESFQECVDLVWGDCETDPDFYWDDQDWDGDGSTTAVDSNGHTIADPDDVDMAFEYHYAECQATYHHDGRGANETGLQLHTFLQDDGFYGLTGPIEPWRSEVLVTSEGDLQLTVHNQLGNGQDFRFNFVIDPDFEPVECIDEGSGAVVALQDGENWVDEWSSDEDDYTIYYLNAGAFQVNPAGTSDWWYLPNEQRAGVSYSKFAAEEFFSHPTDYGDFDLDGEGPAFYEASANYPAFAGFLGVQDFENPDMELYAELAAQLEEQALAYESEMVDIAGARFGDDSPAFFHKIEDNQWREIDHTVQGLDGWMELQSSWVRIKGDHREIVPGDQVEGDFQILAGGLESNSRLLITGTFKTTNIREDRWGYEVLGDVKRAENGTPYCGGAE